MNDFYGNTPLLSVEYYYFITNVAGKQKKHMFAAICVWQRVVIGARTSWVAACGYAPVMVYCVVKSVTGNGS